MDKLGLAIAAATAKPVPKAWKGTVRLRTSGRDVGLVVPSDLSPVELIDLMAFLTSELPGVLRKAQAASQSRILVPQ